MERKQYYNLIYTYCKRRIELKKKFAATGNKKYQRGYQGLTRKIFNWKLQIRRIDNRSEKIWILINCVNKYFGVKIESRNFNSQHKQARSIYYKIGLERKLRGKWLQEAIGRKWRQTATNGRKEFTASFKTNKDNREKFHRFKKHFESTRNEN